ncbi:MAG TPA: flagellar basal body rod protein FlgB [Gammaproteobacteria bacterium]|nr:flagellar basal body rod protein FlgB [Gammaproteobacteria bacterium]
MPINFNSAFGGHDKALLLLADRSAVLAKNLANSDTPNYKARDIDFKSVLQQLDGGAGPDNLPMTTSNPSQLNPGSDASNPPLLYRIPTQPSADGNTVESQIEQAKFSENAVRYKASYTFLSGSIKGLLTAIRGQ